MLTSQEKDIVRPQIPANLIDTQAIAGRVYVTGRYRQAIAGQLDVLEKATGTRLFAAGQATAADVDDAASSAKIAQLKWAATPGPERGDILRRFASLCQQHAEEIIEWVVRETGAIRGKGVFEVELSAREALEAVTLATKPLGELLSRNGARESRFERVPVGTVGVITPWNSPMILAVRSVLPALALGNAVIVKPDPQTPVTGGFMLAQLLHEAGLPDGLFHVLPGAADVGEALVRHPGVPMICFTGSTQVGRHIGAVAGGLLKRVSLELGGKNAFIVCDDADLNRAAMAGAFGNFFHQGQICFTIGRHLIGETVYAGYVDRLVERAGRLKVGDPFRDAVQLGPMINEKQAARAQDLVERSVAMGARVLTGGRRCGLFFEPTVVEVQPGMPLFDEEIFAPIAAVMPVRDDEQAIALANATEYGLVAAIQSSSQQRAEAISSKLATGIVHINDQPVVHEVYGPIGGIGASGNGARTGLPAWEHEFTHMKWITRHSVSPNYPF
ncbi:aldehyde dehydrogenase family protein [Rhizobium sp. WYJ-E13]|uniref:aldehyde dehydrogenase family protein n=1 Tax=Rhizobium sp. WYJ-E13 TaxID=2849093 RepID=UPI001C1F055B|nr:aldehyde dehydrogenase family protein [Rhizobium sp. WYJ-E13]QWW72274.1 aldehyde dehydrogenase family protein [Rhizobium sp. WYJ-E13]